MQKTILQLFLSSRQMEKKTARVKDRIEECCKITDKESKIVD